MSVCLVRWHAALPSHVALYCLFSFLDFGFQESIHLINQLAFYYLTPVPTYLSSLFDRLSYPYSFGHVTSPTTFASLCMGHIIQTIHNVNSIIQFLDVGGGFGGSSILFENNILQLPDAGGGGILLRASSNCWLRRLNSSLSEWIVLTTRQWPGRDVPPTRASSPFVLCDKPVFDYFNPLVNWPKRHKNKLPAYS